MRLTKRSWELIPETTRSIAYWKERSVIRREDDVDGRASVTRDDERLLRGGWTVMRLCRYEGRVVVRTLYVSERILYPMRSLSLASAHSTGWEWCDWSGGFDDSTCTSVLLRSQTHTQTQTYTQGEVTSRNLWPRYDRHFVGIIMCGFKGRSFIVLFKQHSIRWFMKVPVWSLACRQSVFQWCHSEKHLSEFCPQDGGESQLALKLRHLSPCV